MFWQPSRSEPRHYGFALDSHDGADARIVVYLWTNCAPEVSSDSQEHMQAASSGFRQLFLTDSPSDCGLTSFSTIEQAISAAVTHSVRAAPDGSERERLRLQRLKVAMRGVGRTRSRIATTQQRFRGSN